MIYFIIYIFLEVMISSSISSSIGGLMTFFELILSAIFGIMLLRTFQFSLLDKINLVKNGQITQDEFIKSSIGAAIGAMLLIVPGFFTDIIGLLLQFTSFTVIFTKIFTFKKQNSTNYNQNNFSYNSYTTTNRTKKDDDVIDVEIIDDNKSIKH